MKLYALVIVSLISSALAAFDTALFYLIADTASHWTVTWPLVAALFWAQQTTFSIYLRGEFKKEGLL